jgi:hypothetical protein
MNKKGVVSLFSIMFAVLIIILILALATPLTEFANTARNASTSTTLGLDCDNSSISNFDQAACLTTDISAPFFIAAIIGLAGVIVGARLVFGGSAPNE